MASGADDPRLEVIEGAPEAGDDAVVEVATERFGAMRVPASAVLRMVSPVFGFPRSRRYCVLPVPEDEEPSPFRWLQSLDQPELAFVVINPFEFFPEYDIELPTPDQRELEIETAEECAILAIVTIPQDNPQGLTANLVAPLVVNSRTGAARQIVLYESGYLTRHPLLGASDAASSE